MQFIVFPGKILGSKLPVAKTSWYNEQILRTIATHKLQDYVHYRKLKNKPSGSYTLHSNSSNNFVTVHTSNRKRNEAVFIFSSIDIIDHEPVTTVHEEVIMDQLKISALEMKVQADKVLAHLLSGSVVETKQNITQVITDPYFFYGIKTVDTCTEDGKSYYVINTNNISMPEVAIEKHLMVGTPSEMDIVVVFNEKHICINRVDFYRHYTVG